ncbi:hypothetical protein BGZ46_009965, partial [Entomortierella lignicola]
MEHDSNYQTVKLEIDNNAFNSSQEQKGSSIEPYFSASGSSVSENSSKSLTSMGQSRTTDESVCQTLSQDDDDSNATTTTTSSIGMNARFQYSTDMQITATTTTTISSDQDVKFQQHFQQQQQQQQQHLSDQSSRVNESPPPTSSSLFSSNGGSGGGVGDSELPEDIAIRRAEQNRAAQRAFRQRKQKYIKWLESKAEELDEVYRVMALVRAENQQLCNLVAELNAKLSIPNISNSSNNRNGVDSKNNFSDSSGAGGGGGQGFGPITGLKNSASKRVQGIDESLGREISMRLLNLAGLGMNEDGDVTMTATGKNKFQQQQQHQKSLTKSKVGAKGKMAFKMSQQSRHQEALIQAALQPSHLMAQPQSHHQQQQQQQQQQHQQQQQQQQQRQQQRHSFAGLSSGEQAMQLQNGIPWMNYPPSLSVSSSANTNTVNPLTSQ